MRGGETERPDVTAEWEAAKQAMPWNTLPSPGVCTNGQRPCNKPLVVDGRTVGYCSRLVWPDGYARWWRLPPGTHKGPHRMEWT